MIDVLGEINLPTASRSNGLGTGEFDEGASLEFTKSIAPRYMGLADVGYTVIGSPPGTDLNNQWHYSLGGGYYVIPKKLMGRLTFEEYRALVSGDPNPIDLLSAAHYHVTPHVRIECETELSRSTSSSCYAPNF